MAGRYLPEDPDDDDDEPGKLTADEAAEIEALSAKRHAKFAEIMSVIARDLGYDPATLSPAEQEEVEATAEEACEEWLEAEMDTPVLQTPLQLLLREHHDLGEFILNIEDDAIARDLRGEEG